MLSGKKNTKSSNFVRPAAWNWAFAKSETLKQMMQIIWNKIWRKLWEYKWKIEEQKSILVSPTDDTSVQLRMKQTNCCYNSFRFVLFALLQMTQIAFQSMHYSSVFFFILSASPVLVSHPWLSHDDTRNYLFITSG